MTHLICGVVTYVEAKTKASANPMARPGSKYADNGDVQVMPDETALDDTHSECMKVC